MTTFHIGQLVRITLPPWHGREGQVFEVYEDGAYCVRFFDDGKARYVHNLNDDDLELCGERHQPGPVDPDPHALLARHDVTYYLSDAPDTYRRGRNEVNQILRALSGMPEDAQADIIRHWLGDAVGLIDPRLSMIVMLDDVS